MSLPALRRFAGLVACSLLLAIGALLLADALLRHSREVAAGALLPPANAPAQGLVYDGLAIAPDGPCKGGYQLPNSGLCTHGPDAAPPGVDVSQGQAPVPLAARPSAASQCTDDGTSGYRTQVIYARASDSPSGDRYNTYLPSFRQWVAAADDIYNASAAETGGSRHIRFVTDSTCAVVVLNVVLSSAADDTFDKTISELQALGYNHTDRKYMVFMDANVLCGIGTLYNDDRPGTENYNNGGYVSYARVDAPCWGAHAVAHEHMHNLGGVQDSAPHSTGGGHCYDEFDVMCYADIPTAPAMQRLCADIAHEDRFDCDHDDYYNTNPAPGSYLATHWNAANSRFLVAGSSLVTPSPSPSAASSPAPASPSPQPNPVAATFQLTLQATTGGGIAPMVSGKYRAGQVITMQAQANDGYLFLGWTIDNADRGWANPLSLTIDADHTVRANFVPRPRFNDVPAGDPAAEAIAQLAARGVIRGYDPATFGPGDRVLRAQMAALIARAMVAKGYTLQPCPDRRDAGRER
jgi:hypothetical protein